MGANKLVLIGLLAAILSLTSGCIDSGISSPGDAVKPITVGASDQYGRVAEFSSSGPTSDGRTKPTLVAPGVDIISCRAWNTEMSEPVDEYYVTASGTSMSAPYTAGAAALLLQANPDLTPAGVKAALTTTAVKLDNTKGHEYEEFYQGTGEIDVYQAYLAVNNDPLAGIVPDRWIAGVWAYTGLAYGADRPTKKVYAVSPGCEDVAKFVFATDQELSGVTISTSGTAGYWITAQPLPDSIPANGQETCYATLTVPDGVDSGTYTGNITISGDEGAVLTVPVTVNIAQSVEMAGGIGAFNGSLDDCEWEYFYFDVPASTERLEVALKDYTGGSDLILFTPRHECIDRNQRGRTDTDTEIIKDPSAGRWMAIVYGNDISETTTFNGTVAIYTVTCTPPRWNPGVLKPDDITSQSFTVANDGIGLSNASLDAIILNITEAHRFKGSVMEQGNVSEYFDVPSGPDQFELAVTCDDVDCKLYLELRSPDGNYAGYSYTNSGVARIRVTEPTQGRWQVTIYCGYLPSYTEFASFRGAVDLYRHESCDWIGFDNDTIGRLPSGSDLNFTATMSVPDSVEPGDYAAAIEISSDQETFDIPVSFVVQTPLFSEIGPDHGRDTDGDELYDYLTVNVSLNSGISGEYQLRGRLEDGAGNYLWADTTIEATGADDQTVQIDFEGTGIWKNRINDTYSIYLYMYNRRGDLLDRSNYTTAHHNYTEFQPLPAIFTDVYFDNGVDTDGDGLYDYLVIDVGVDVTDAGNYEVRATLCEHGSMSAWVDSDSNSTHLNSGNQTVQLRFYGPALRQNGYDGRYDLRDLCLYDTTHPDSYPMPPIPIPTPISVPEEPVKPENATALYEEVDHREIAYTTAYYNHTDFQRPPAEFTGNFSDYGLDTDNDTLYDYLVVEVEVNVTKAGMFEWYGGLEYNNEASGQHGWLGDDWNMTYLDSGIRNITMRFDGVEIYLEAYNGSFETWLYLIESGEGYMLDEMWTSTSDYDYTDFQRPPAEFTGNFSDYGLDTDNDTLYDYLVIDVEVNVTKAGMFELGGGLEYHNEASGQHGGLGSDRNMTYLDSGIRNITLRFDGVEIYREGYNGRFETRLNLQESGKGYLLDDMRVSTSNYNYTDFQRPPAEFTGNFSDYGLDTDNDTLYNYLVIEAEVNVTKAGNYTLHGALDYCGDGSGQWGWINGDGDGTHLDSGIRNITMRFDGVEIYNTGCNGSFETLLILDGDGERHSMDYMSYSTNDYVYTNFQRPPAEFTGNFVDYGLDTDNDTLYDYLVIEAEVNVTKSGEYKLYGALDYCGDGPGHWGWINGDGNKTHLDSGIRNITMRFDGVEIYNTGYNGSFETRLTLLEAEEKYPIDGRGYATSDYNYSDFQRPPAEFTGNFIDYGLDTDNDTLYDYLMIKAEVNVLKAGEFELRGYLECCDEERGYWACIGGAGNTTYLNSGIRNITMRFDGVKIYGTKYTGSFEAWLTLCEAEEMHPVDETGYSTGKYDYTDFQRPPSGEDPPIIAIADAAIALKLAASGGWDPDADVNNDGRVTSVDALIILEAAARG